MVNFRSRLYDVEVVSKEGTAGGKFDVFLDSV